MKLTEWHIAHDAFLPGWSDPAYTRDFVVGCRGIAGIEATPAGVVVTHEGGGVALFRDGWGQSAAPAPQRNVEPTPPSETTAAPKRKRGRPRKQHTEETKP